MRLIIHLVWATKYHHSLLKIDIQIRCCSLMKRKAIEILKGVVSKNHVYLRIDYRSSQDLSNIVELLKGHISIKFLIDFSILK
ncbi:MAG: transposase [Flavobacteriaceae bacterium]|nr:transposase [Flavobacteriaceae bacterium]